MLKCYITKNNKKKLLTFLGLGMRRPRRSTFKNTTWSQQGPSWPENKLRKWRKKKDKEKKK